MNQTISQAELVIMKMLWENSPLSAENIYHQINELIKERKWRKATVKTLINRLLKKGLISYEQQGRTYLYQPNIVKETYLADQNKSFLNDMYDGKLTDLMAAFTTQEKLSSSEINEIKKLIEGLEQKK